MFKKFVTKLTFFTSVFFLTFLFTACSDEDRDSLLALSELADDLEKVDDLEESKFEANCMDKLNIDDEEFDVEAISPSKQTRLVGIFNDCIEAIEDELELTEKEFSISEATKLCFDGVNEIRNYLPELTEKIQKFSQLPNNTKEERIAISMLFSFTSMDIIAKGGAAMINRTVSCGFGLKETDEES